MRIQIQKRKDGNVVLKCVRADGSETWQKQEKAQAAFFPFHDLTHFAVESELGLDSAFFGLIASGWTIEETGQRGSAAVLPSDALFAESVVGTLDTERAGGQRWTAKEFNDTIALKWSTTGRTVPRVLTDDEILRIRKTRAELFERWRSLRSGETLELEWSS